jgi:replication factor C small subunit
MITSIWTEKYRPQTISNIIGHDEIKKRISSMVQKKEMPHLLLAGPAGVGKTSFALCIAKDLFGETWRNNVLELNASDERGRDVIRTKVKDFARTKAIGNVPFKIIYLDESDALTRDAQQALRRTMENYTNTCRFILSCNYSSKLIDPIQSRCAIFRFSPLKKNDLEIYVRNVCQVEELNCDEKGMQALFEATNGDCRKITNLLQSCASQSKNITEEVVYSNSSHVNKEKVVSIINMCRNNFQASRKELCHLLYNQGLSGLDVCRLFHSALWDTELKENAKLLALKELAEAEFRIVEGAESRIQLESFLATVAINH